MKGALKACRQFVCGSSLQSRRTVYIPREAQQSSMITVQANSHLLKACRRQKLPSRGLNVFMGDGSSHGREDGGGTTGNIG